MSTKALDKLNKNSNGVLGFGARDLSTISHTDSPGAFCSAPTWPICPYCGRPLVLTVEQVDIRAFEDQEERHVNTTELRCPTHGCVTVAPAQPGYPVRGEDGR